MIRFNDLKIKFQVLIAVEGKDVEALYFESSTLAKEFVGAYNLRMPSANPIHIGGRARYNGALSLD